MNTQLAEVLVASAQVDPLDIAILTASPVAVVPHRGDFEPLAVPGRRLLLAADGVYLEARSHVLYVRIPLARVSLPFGPTDFALEMAGDRVPLSVLDALLEASVAAHPREMARLVVRDADGHDSLIAPEQRGSAAAVHYDDRGIDESRLLIDAHSHGEFPATFSLTDNTSDRTRIGPHISVVVGKCGDRSTCELSARVCVSGHLYPISGHTLRELFA